MNHQVDTAQGQYHPVTVCYGANKKAEPRVVQCVRHLVLFELVAAQYDDTLGSDTKRMTHKGGAETSGPARN
jgi:hypothetical protein